MEELYKIDPFPRALFQASRKDELRQEIVGFRGSRVGGPRCVTLNCRTLPCPFPDPPLV